jgi:hypothetical protein
LRLGQAYAENELEWAVDDVIEPWMLEELVCTEEPHSERNVGTMTLRIARLRATKGLETELLC